MGPYETDKEVAEAIGKIDLRLPYKPKFIIGKHTSSNIIDYNKQMAKYYLELAKYAITDEEYQHMLKNAGLDGQNKLYDYLQKRKRNKEYDKSL